MFPACIVIAGTATFSGISGAALMTPMFLIVFPLLRIPRLTTVAAIGAALFLETAGFGAGVYHYARMRLADLRTARRLIAVTAPAAVGGAFLAHHAPTTLLRIAYGVAMIAIAWVLGRPTNGPARRPKAPCPCLVCESECSSAGEDCPPAQRRHLQAADGKIYDWCALFERAQRVISGFGAFLAGLISTGVGEATLPTLVRKGRFPVPVAAATSTLVVAGTVVAASLAHGILLALQGGWTAIPWNLIVWGVPGAIIGAAIGTRLQGRVSERAARVFFATLFAAIGVVFLLAFTVFARRFQ
jgi:uncharacterized membrane protein YfcA